MENGFWVHQSQFDSPEISTASIELKGLNPNGVVMNTEDTVSYCCLKGELLFAVEIDNSFNLIKLGPGNSVKIPPMTRYVDYSQEGSIFLAISKPEFAASQVIKFSIPKDVEQLIGIYTFHLLTKPSA